MAGDWDALQFTPKQRKAESSSDKEPASNERLMMVAADLARREAIMPQLMVNMQHGMEAMMSQLVTDMRHSMEAIMKTFVDALHQVAGTIEQTASRTEQALETVGDGVEKSNKAVVEALSKGKRVVRGADGRVSGMETIQ